MFWEFKQDNTSKRTAEKICIPYGESIVCDREIRNEFLKFYSGHRALKEGNVAKVKEANVDLTITF